MKKKLSIEIIKELLGGKEDIIEALREEMVQEARKRKPDTVRIRKLSRMYDEVSRE